MLAVRLDKGMSAGSTNLPIRRGKPRPSRREPRPAAHLDDLEYLCLAEERTDDFGAAAVRLGAFDAMLVQNI